MKDLYERVRAQIAAVVVGQDDALAQILGALACSGHVLIEGPPGVAKTLLARSVARALGLEFRAGPIFTNILLADEINRTPPKTQAALLEAMQEGQVSVDGNAHALPDPFLVVATQNPIEYEGTYPLPEAQLDRFMVRVDIGYPSAEQERRILSLPRQGLTPSTLAGLREVVSRDELRAARRKIDETAVSDEVAGYVVDLVRRTRELPSVSLGASPRAAVHLLVAAKAAARLSGRAFLTPDDVVGIAPAALAHRLILTPEAELERFGARDAIRAAIDDVPVPR